MKDILQVIFATGILFGPHAHAAPQDGASEQRASFSSAADDIEERLKTSIAELAKLREEVAAETVPLSRRLSALEQSLVEIRAEYTNTTRLLDSRALDLGNLTSEIKARESEASYLSNLLSEYVRNFETRLHITELQRYADGLEAAKLAAENSSLSQEDLFKAQAGLVRLSFDRIHDSLGGTRFAGSAVNSEGIVQPGNFVLVGPAAIFAPTEGEGAGTAEQRLGSLEPTQIDFALPEDVEATRALVARGSGSFPLDSSLGNAHKIADTQETFLEHVQKGGPVMYPIFGMAGLALLVALFKWFTMLFVRKPSLRKARALYAAMDSGDDAAIKKAASKIKGPAGQMVSVGLGRLGQPRELIEEAMYEVVLTTRLKVQGMLPFIAIVAASAPLMGLLGTVTGIINTFKMITVFGSGDVKSLSGGISEALITTKFGLIVAIPSLLLHAFLSRKARGVTDRMEEVAVGFVNTLSSDSANNTQKGPGDGDVDSSEVRAQVQEILGELLGPLQVDSNEAGGLETT